MFEHRRSPLVSRAKFLRRVARHGGYAVALLAVSIVGGVAGFHYLAGQSVVDAFVNATMLLGGMGLVGEIPSMAGKLFAAFFALYAGIVFLGVATLLGAPVLHRFMHRFHIEDQDRG